MLEPPRGDGVDSAQGVGRDSRAPHEHGEGAGTDGTAGRGAGAAKNRGEDDRAGAGFARGEGGGQIMGRGRDQEALAQGPDGPGASGEALGEVDAIGGQTDGQAGVRPDQEDEATAAGPAGERAALGLRVRRPEGAEDHAGAARQEGDRPLGPRGPDGIGEEQQGRQGLPRAAGGP